ncbi:Alkaline phosphatase [Hypsibius exemplaris]|uniref:Alkaline phosphatase n=1 Tax=Hypsibius exemplaris TaxID=2072580 RepID=A0A1W0XFJ8_HYPEX|nr:Alkaline phosphatase [Hypsibius exemplaris]
MDLRWLFVCTFLLVSLKELKAETPQQWIDIANAELQRALNNERIVKRPKNVVLFLGDGMGVATLTAARIYKGQMGGANGEETSLTFEKFPNLGLSKTYNDNAQIPDSAGTATAYLCGQKAALGVIGVNSNATFGDCASATGNHITSILEWAQQAGKVTGIVTTTTITHATPAAAYAHTPSRDWESYVEGTDEDRKMCKDIARQLVEDLPGQNIRVIFGGGRQGFVPNNETDPAFGSRGARKDGRNLLRLKGLDVSNTDFVLGLFGPSHLAYDLLRERDGPKQPTLKEMTTKAIDILQKDPNGFFLLVEGGKIDHAHHAGQARLALHDTVAFDAAIEAAVAMLPADDTLFVVTADHSHTIGMGGYPSRGNGILKGPEGVRAKDGLPYLTLSYANGPGASQSGSRRDLTDSKTEENEFLQEALVPLSVETHGGEDVAIYAKGPFAHLFHTLHEQHYIAVAMDYAACYRSNTPDHCRSPAPTSSGNDTREATTAASRATSFSAAATLIIVACFCLAMLK